jgi:hypothetical protein
MMRRFHIAVLAALAVGLVAIVTQFATSGASNPIGSSRVASLSADERASRDRQARIDIDQLNGSLLWHPRFPTELPAGYTYDRVIWHSDHPEFGFEIFISAPDGSTNRAIHLTRIFHEGGPHQISEPIGVIMGRGSWARTGGRPLSAVG